MATEIITLKDKETNQTAYPYTVDGAVKRQSVSGLPTTVKETLDSLENRTSQAAANISALETSLANETAARQAADASKIDRNGVQDISSVNEAMVSGNTPISAHAMGLMKQYVDDEVSQTIITPESGSIVADNATIESEEIETNVHQFSVKDGVFPTMVQHNALNDLVDDRTTYDGDDVTDLIPEWSNVCIDNPTYEPSDFSVFHGVDGDTHNGVLTLKRYSTVNYRPNLDFSSLENGKDYRLSLAVSMPAGISFDLRTAKPAKTNVGYLTDIYGNNIVLQNRASYDVLIHKTSDWDFVTFDHPQSLNLTYNIEITISNFAVKQAIYVNEPDEVPTTDSDKLVKSGGVKNALDTITENLNELDETTIKKSVLGENYHPVKNLINTNDLLWGYCVTTADGFAAVDGCVMSNKIVFEDGVTYAFQGIGAYGTNKVMGIGYFGSDDSYLGIKLIDATLDDPSVLRGKALYTHTNYPVETAYCRVNLALYTSAPLDTTLCQIEEGNEYTEVVGYEEVVNFGFVSKQDLEEEEERAKESEQFASRGFYVDYHKVVSSANNEYKYAPSYDSILVPITSDYKKITCVGATPYRFNFFNSPELIPSNFIERNQTGDVPDGAKLCAISLGRSAHPNGYTGVWINISSKVQEAITEKKYVALTPNGIEENNYVSTDGNHESSRYDIYSYNVDATKSYAFSGYYGATVTLYMINFCDANGDVISQAYQGNWSQATEYINEPLTLPTGTSIIKMNVRNNSTASQFNLSEVNVGYYNFAQIQSDIDDLKKGNVPEGQAKLMKVIKNGTNIAVRTRLSNENDIVICMHESDNNITFEKFCVGYKDLSDNDLITKGANKVRDTPDMVGAFGINSFWFMYGQHGWSIPLITASGHGLDSLDLGSVWEDQNNRQFTIGKIDGNHIYLLPVITKNVTTNVYSASWNNGSTVGITTLTHVSGATHTSQITVTKKERYDLQVQTSQTRKFIADGMELTENGTYYCDEFEIKEHILGWNVGKVNTWFPEPVYNGSLMDFDRSFVFKGSGVACNMVINTEYPWEVTDYRGCIPQMPMKKGDYHSYTLIPKVKKMVNSNRVDLPFNTDSGNTSVSVIRNSADLYDVNDQPDRCITYLKDDNDNYFVGMAGGYSLLRGITTKENRNLYVPSGTTCSFSPDSSTKNKFYPRALVSGGFEDGIVPDTFIKEFCMYFCWFNPADNVGQVYWYKDGNDYIVYAHCQTEHDKLAINLPHFMEGLTVDSTIEKTDGATLLTNQVINGKLYVSYDTTDNDANYIVLKLN